MTKVIEAMVFTTEVTNVGDVYLRLAKYMFRVKLTLQSVQLLFACQNDINSRCV
jgi:hypothetical protein